MIVINLKEERLLVVLTENSNIWYNKITIVWKLGFHLLIPPPQISVQVSFEVEDPD